jgi:hypothetical protein
MNDGFELPIDNLETKIREATREALRELNLDAKVRLDSVNRQIDSTKIHVGLAERVGPQNTEFHSFAVQPEEALEAQGGAAITVESLKPFVIRELQKLFP